MKRIISPIDWVLKRPVLAHVLFWLGLLFSNSLWSSLYSGTLLRHLIHNATMIPFAVVATYALLYWQIPVLLRRKKYFLFAGSLAVVAYCCAVFNRIAIIYIAEPLTRKDFSQESIAEIVGDPLYLLVVYVPAMYWFTLWLAIARGIKDRYAVKEQLQILKEEKLRTELKLLKSQIHPHFLFNTLNNLYALTLQKSDQAPEVVAKLSELLSFLLYEGSKPSVPLARELELLRNYLDLEVLRYGDELELSFVYDVVDPGLPVAPLIMIGLVENAFKHAVRIDPDDAVVRVSLTQRGGELCFVVINSLPKKTVDSTSGHGLGMRNLRSQLAMLYPDRHQLRVEQRPKSFTVELTLDISQPPHV